VQPTSVARRRSTPAFRGHPIALLCVLIHFYEPMNAYNCDAPGVARCISILHCVVQQSHGRLFRLPRTRTSLGPHVGFAPASRSRRWVGVDHFCSLLWLSRKPELHKPRHKRHHHAEVAKVLSKATRGQSVFSSRSEISRDYICYHARGEQGISVLSVY